MSISAKYCTRSARQTLEHIESRWVKSDISGGTPSIAITAKNGV